MRRISCRAGTLSIIVLHEINIDEYSGMFDVAGAGACFQKCGFKGNGLDDRRGPAIVDEPGILAGQSPRAV